MYSLPTKPSRLHAYPHSTRRSNSAAAAREAGCGADGGAEVGGGVQLRLRLVPGDARPPLQPPPPPPPHEKPQPKLKPTPKPKATRKDATLQVETAAPSPRIELAGRALRAESIATLSGVEDEEGDAGLDPGLDGLDELRDDSEEGRETAAGSVSGDEDGHDDDDFEEDSELELDDEEEQEISDFDSSGEYDEDEEEEDEDGDLDDDERITTGCTQSTSISNDDLVRNWDRSPGTKKISAVKLGKKCDSAKRYGIAVMIGDTIDTQQGEFASIRKQGSEMSENLLKLKPAIVPSLFDDGDAVLYFPKEGEAVTKIPTELKEAMKWKICKFTPRVVRTCLRRAGFKLVKGGRKWIGYWGKHYPAEKFKTVQPWQKVNHFPMSFEIGRKDKMYLNVTRMRERVKDETLSLDFLPATYFLPTQRRRLKLAFNSHPTWIIKPPASARGIGIRVVNKWKDVPQRKDIIVSKYVQNPYLIDKKKFDIRLYVVVTSFDPLRIYLFKEGIVRFAGENYSTNSSRNSIRNRYIHLTNYSVSRKKKKNDASKDTTPSYPFGDPIFSTASSKWSLATLEDHFTRQGIKFDEIMEKIKHVIISTIISAHATNSSGTRMYATSVNSCYELFGFDVLLDANLKPWVMEVNISPSLKSSCDMDLGVKSRLSVDLFNLVGIRVKDLDQSQKKRKKSSGKPFLTIGERQKIRHFSQNHESNILADLTESDLRVLKESEDENQRKGAFDRIFPYVDSSKYFKLFASYPYYDHLLLQWTKLAAKDNVRAYNLLRRLPYGFSHINSNNNQGSVRRANSARTISTPRSSISTNTAKERAILQQAPTHPKKTVEPRASNSNLPPYTPTPTGRIESTNEQRREPSPRASVASSNAASAHFSTGPMLYPEYPSTGNPYTAFPERQAIHMKRSDLGAAAGITPHLNSSYILRPRKLSLRQKQLGYGPSDAAMNQQQQHAQMSENMAGLIAQEMQQLQLQQQLHRLHQQKMYYQQQQQKAQQRANSAASLAQTMTKEYPSTSAYTAAMAIAHVTARFRALEANNVMAPPEPPVARQAISQQELATWAAMKQQHQRNLPMEVNARQQQQYDFVNSMTKKRASSGLRRATNTPID